MNKTKAEALELAWQIGYIADRMTAVGYEAYQLDKMAGWVGKMYMLIGGITEKNAARSRIQAINIYNICVHYFMNAPEGIRTAAKLGAAVLPDNWQEKGI